ncbi:MAG: M20/M25/M40 family metallo-hydrolase, partial [Chloroflexota bacterium]|nr:M20/M25/M40 family metallo-hydrolase [Chloroflexota bacterium]
MKIEPDPERLRRDWQELSEFRDPNQPGWTRRPFTREYQAARQWLAERMRAAGLEIELDPGGNLVGRRLGQAPRAPSMLVGSHMDTVAGGGRFDGIVGVVAALEVSRCLRQRPLRRTLEVVDFLAEEPTDFGISTVGSRAMAGALTSEMLMRQHQGRTLAQAIAAVGGRPNELGQARGDIGHYLELHVEQGPVLEGEGLRLGIVTDI